MPGFPVIIEDPKALALAAGVIAVAILLLLGQELVNRRVATTVGPHADAEKRRRRRLASVLMLATGLTMALASTMGPKRQGAPNLSYVGIWMLVLAEVAGLLTIAWFDLAATRRMAHELRTRLRDENLRDLARELERHRRPDVVESDGLNGHAT